MTAELYTTPMHHSSLPCLATRQSRSCIKRIRATRVTRTRPLGILTLALIGLSPAHPLTTGHCLTGLFKAIVKQRAVDMGLQMMSLVFWRTMPQEAAPLRPIRVQAKARIYPLLNHPESGASFPRITSQ